MSACQQITCSGSWALLCLVFTLCRVKIIWFFLSCQIWHKAYNKCHETTADVKVSEMCIKMSLQVASSLQYLKQAKMLHLVMKIAIFLNFVMNYFFYLSVLHNPTDIWLFTVFFQNKRIISFCFVCHFSKKANKRFRSLSTLLNSFSNIKCTKYS